MTYNYPFYGFPRRYYRYPPYYYQKSPNRQYIKNKYDNTKVDSNIEAKRNMQKEIPHKSEDDSIFEIFGIKLHFDDLLLIFLIFFLYNEGVQDPYLFIALVLLLLS